MCSHPVQPVLDLSLQSSLRPAAPSLFFPLLYCTGSHSALSYQLSILLVSGCLAGKPSRKLQSISLSSTVSRCPCSFLVQIRHSVSGDWIPALDLNRSLFFPANPRAHQTQRSHLLSLPHCPAQRTGTGSMANGGQKSWPVPSILAKLSWLSAAVGKERLPRCWY